MNVQSARSITIQQQVTRTFHSEIIIHSGFLYSPTCLNYLRSFAKRHVLFCDPLVKQAIGDDWLNWARFHQIDVRMLTLPVGEACKTRKCKADLEDQLLTLGMGKEDGFIVLGGGAATDLIGFLASTYCRGAPLIAIPTTLLAMVDASIGGKTAVNTPFGKNLIGSFYLPSYTWIDDQLLTSLPENEWNNGCAEIIKYALIQSPLLFEHLTRWDKKTHVLDLIEQSIAIKHQIVSSDFDEKLGWRHVLNFGHTLGHALEYLEGWKISHGAAVAFGMLAESFISWCKGLLSERELNQIVDLIHSFSFDFTLSRTYSLEEWMTVILRDKKTRKAEAQCVLLKGIGQVYSKNGVYLTSVKPDWIGEALAWISTLNQAH